MNKKILMALDGEFHKDERVQNEVKILADSGNLVSILHFNFDDPTKNNSSDEKIKSIPITISKRWKNKWFFFANISNKYYNFWSKQIEDVLKREQYDAIHFHDLYMWKTGMLLRKKYKIPMVLDLHENYPQAVCGYLWATKFPNFLFAQPWRWKSFEKKYLHHADRIIVLSDYFKKKLLSKNTLLDETNIFIYPNVPNVQKLLDFPVQNEIIPKSQKDTFLLYFGGISARRGVFTLIDAFEKVIEKVPYVKLLLIGPVDKAEVKIFDRKINNKKISNHIVFVPWIDFKDLPSFLKISDICLSPIVKNAQHESGVANKVFQYMLFEKPVVVSNCYPQEQIVNEEKCGVVFKSEDSSDLLDKLISLIENKELQKKMGQAGKKAVLEKYNTVFMGKQLLSLYESIKEK
jgi:glycosyltransferase involved in cell wall biosynthesis